MPNFEDMGIAMEWEELILMPTVILLGYLARKVATLSERVAWLEGRGGHDLGEAIESKGGE